MYPEATVKITQYCSVCREELAMEVVNTGDGEEDGVTWLRCPHCEGFLPKIDESPADTEAPEPSGMAVESDAAPSGFGADTDPLDSREQSDQGAEPERRQLEDAEPQQLREVTEQSDFLVTPPMSGDDNVSEPTDELRQEAPLLGDEDVDILAADAGAEPESIAVAAAKSRPATPADSNEPTETEDLTAYQAQLAAADISSAMPYRPWDSYEVGDVVHQLAWDDCGIVVAKESLPGKRSVIKVFFERTGIVRLIEQAARES